LQLTSEKRKVYEDVWRLCGYRTLLSEVNLKSRETVEECVEVIHEALGNIVDLLDTQRLGIKAEIFEYFQDLKAHTMKPGKRIHRATAERARCRADIRAREHGAS
jgi:hypothetical protein